MIIAEHTSFLTVDHVSEACKIMFSDSSAVKNMKLHRTKCKNIIVNVLAPHFIVILKADIGAEKYSLIIDESTDISVIKLLGVTVRYFSREFKKIASTFLGIVELEYGTTQSIVNALKKLLFDVQLNPQNLLGIGVDYASVNVGLNNGVCELLKKDLGLPNLIMVHCICHSIQLALPHAMAETLPRSRFLVRETYSSFSQSSKRQQIYKTLFEALNDGRQPLQTPRVCDTRWISLEPTVTRILSQWEELKMHFNIARSDEKCYAAEMSYNMYNDPINKFYMLFLRPVLQDVQRTVKVFQGENVDPTKLLSDLSYLVNATSRKVLIPTLRIDP
ncbi:zinc finger protein 862-like [Macrobrachium rosenbergii]|uniref:zinc finger protein 862-like n=1 Tax=Macrobrachium rosenbergii TaxID=79674 RepID=UPI0034D3BF29